MSGDATLTGLIRIEPPIGLPELREHMWAYGGAPHYPDALLHVETETVNTPDGVLTRKTALGIVPTACETSGNTLVEDVDRIVQTFAAAPDGTPRTFTGHLHMVWGPGEYTCRVVVRDGRAVKVEPQIVWPDDATGGARWPAARKPGGADDA